MKKCKGLLGLTAAAAMLLSTTACENRANINKPEKEIASDPMLDANQNLNILFITTDQERYFSEFPEGTNYKARELLMEMGTTFEKHYTCSNVSTSSRSVIYTGTHITHTKMIDNANYVWQNSLSTDITTTGDIMREAGYYTALKGKWHLSNFDWDDREYEGPALQMKDELEEYGFSDWNTEGEFFGNTWEGYKVDGVITGSAVSWLRETGAKNNSEGNPFFLAVNLVNPHDVMYYNPALEAGEEANNNVFISAGEPINKIYETTYQTPVPSSWNEPLDGNGRVPAHNEFRQSWSKIMNVDVNTESEWQSFQNYYFNCLQDSDDNLMTILNELTNLDMLDNTIIVFTSDHGDMQGAHGLWGKGGFIYEYNTHVPLIIYHPKYEGGKTVSAVTSHLDLATTFVDMTNLSDNRKAELTEGLAGGSILDLMDGSATKIREGALFAFEMLSLNGKEFNRVLDNDGKTIGFNLDEEKRGALRGIITKRYKFARYFSPIHFNTPTTFEELYANNDVELFDLENDPNELANLAAQPEANKELIMEMNAMLNELIHKEIGIDNGAEVAAAHKIIRDFFGD